MSNPVSVSNSAPGPEPVSALPKGPVIITVCTSCRLAGTLLADAPGRVLFQTLAAALAGRVDVIVRPTQCMSVCTRVSTASLSCEGGYTFVFGDLAPESAPAALVAMAEDCARADYGFVPWKARPDLLRQGLIARLPPPGWSPEDGGQPG